MSGRGPERKRVLVLINDLATGGAQRAALDQAAALDPDRFAVELASLELRAPGPWGAPRFRHVPVHRLGAPRAWAAAWNQLGRRLQLFCPDLVHAHLVAAGIAGTLGARLARVPRVVVTFHNLTDWQEKRSHPLRVAGRRALRWCDAVVAVSEAVRGAMARVDLALARRAHVIPNGIDLSLFAGLGRRRDEARALRGLGPDEIVVGTVARLERRKGVDLLIEAMPLVAARLPRLKLRVIGDGPERSSLEGRVRQLGLGERVELVGERGDVHEELAALDLFAAPSRSEGQGVAVIEALAAGLPVIGARVGGIPEVLGHGACGVLVEPESPGALADAIVGLALSDERRRFSESGRARARSFSLDETRARLERLYESLLARSEERAAA